MNEPKSYLIEIAGQMPDAIYERALQDVVRCRECKYMLHYHAEESKDRKDFYWCMLADWKCGVQLYRDSGFCAWGIRRESDES